VAQTYDLSIKNVNGILLFESLNIV
jgi:hypothetical protein